jgi:Mrp family chromosome partitioning ATPase
VSNSFSTLRAEHSLVARAFQSARGANARRILLVSARSGDGKSHFARCIQRHANVVTNEPCEVQSFSPRWPADENGKGYVWVDGVALLEGAGAGVLRPSVRASFHGVLFVARGLVTTRAELAECGERLRTLEMPVLGGIWNSFECPPPAEAVRAFKEGLRTWPPRFPPGVFARQTRRSS